MCRMVIVPIRSPANPHSGDPRLIHAPAKIVPFADRTPWKTRENVLETGQHRRVHVSGRSRSPPVRDSELNGFRVVLAECQRVTARDLGLVRWQLRRPPGLGFPRDPTQKSRLRGASLAGRGGERVVNLWRSSLKRSRDLGPIFDPIGPSRPHPGRDGFGTETFGSRCECGKPCKERRERYQAESVALGLVALTRW